MNEEEINYIKKYNTLIPNGYNKYEKGNNIEKSSDNGKSEIGHNKQSIKCKEKYKEIDCLKDLEDIPRGICYYTRLMNGVQYHGFRVRKVGIKNKEYIYSINSKNKLSDALRKAKEYLIENEQRVSASLIV